MKRIYIGFVVISMVFLSGAHSCPKSDQRLDASATMAKKSEAPKEEQGAQKLEPAGQQCRSDDDCTTIKNDCCGCRQGGAQKAIAKAALDSAELEQKARCLGTMCIQAISTDASCGKNSVCESGNCILK